jgi:hypothetical protein
LRRATWPRVHVLHPKGRANVGGLNQSVLRDLFSEYNWFFYGHSKDTEVPVGDAEILKSGDLFAPKT